MKKFSKSINQKVNEEPKKEYKIDEVAEFKHQLLSLMERYLKVQSYGPVDDRYLNGSVTIEGKEMLAEALLELLSDKSDNKQTALLESLKSEISNWEVIDRKIDSINENKPALENKVKFNKFLDKYSSDEESLIMISESKASNITKEETLNDYIKLVESSKLSENTKYTMKEIYKNRLNEINE